MATMASSTILPMVGCLALAWRKSQRASLGTQKTLCARYSSRSSGSAPSNSPLPATSFARCSSNVSEIYLRKMSPSTTCLYSAASMLLRSLSAVSQSLASKPILAADLAVDDLAWRGMARGYRAVCVIRAAFLRNASFLPRASRPGTFRASHRLDPAPVAFCLAHHADVLPRRNAV